MDDKKKILLHANSLNSVPASALQAMRKLQDTNSNIGEVVQLINYDPGMTSNILRLANSSYYGCTKAISSLRDAIVRLGSKNILPLITAAVASAAIKTKIRGYAMTSDQLWDHSVAVAVASENLAEILKIPGDKIAFTAGLLHDIGKVLMGKHMIDKKIRKVFEEALLHSDSLINTERKLYNIDHAEAGGFLLGKWNIPDGLVQSVRFHHSPFDSENPNAAVVHIADVICVQNNIGFEYPSPKASFFSGVLEKMNVSSQIIEEVAARTQDSFENIKDVFSGK